jgi:regulator of sigma E protease
MLIVVAGPAANFLLAIVLYWGLFWYGTEEFKPLLGLRRPSSAAAAAGLEDGELVLKVGWRESPDLAGDALAPAAAGR